MGPGFMPPRKRPDDNIEKPKSLKEVPSYIGKVLSGFFKRLFYIIGLVWEAKPSILIAMVFLCVITGLLPVAGAYISRELLNRISDAMGLFGSDSLMKEAFSGIVVILVFQFLYMFVSRVSQRISHTINSLAGEIVVNHIKLKIMNKAKTVDNASFDRPEFYEKMENANREASMRPIMILRATFDVISTIISAVSFVVILAGLHPLAPVLIILMALPTAIVTYIFRHRNFRYIRHHSKERREMEYYSSQLVDKDKVKEMRIMNLSDTFIDKYKDAFSRYYKGLKHLIINEGIISTLIGLLSVLANCALFAFVAYRVVYGENMQIGDYSLYTGALTSITSCVTSLISSSATIYEGTLFINNMMIFMSEEPTIVPRTKEALIPTPHVPHVIEFKNVSFRYPGAEKNALTDINLTVKSGESVVLAGLNGAGKTTLIKLLTRLYDPTSGAIYLDGHDLRDYDVEALYSLYGIIFQDFGKYAVSASENITFGDVEAEHNENSIKAAAVAGGADAFIAGLPQGYKTPLMRFFEENGAELSIGQWQKLAISRAFYKSSDILILDEPTASLDPMAEQDVYDQFAELSRDKITIFVSHRLSSATTASKVVVIENGVMLEEGPHEALMAKKGRYYELFSTQAKHYYTSEELE